MSTTTTPPAPRVGVLLVAGFLGAGKTTLVTRLLRDPRVGPGLAVLVNDLGALGLDGELLRAAAETAALRTVQLDNGCICCTLKGALGDALTELARPATGAPPRQIVVELSGAALASEVHFQVGTQALGDDAPFFADGLICVVAVGDAERWQADERELFEDQLRGADVVLLSKADRHPAAALARTEALVKTVAPRASVVTCTFGEIDPALLLGLGPNKTTPPRPSDARHTLRGQTVRFDGAIRAPALQALLDDAAFDLYRIKGRVRIDDANESVVQCVGGSVEMTTAPAGSGPSRLTFIGRAVDVARWSDAALLAKRLGTRAEQV